MLEVVLVPASNVNRDGVPRFFVEVKGFPHGHTYIVTSALPRARAEEVKKGIEDTMDAYRRPKRKGGRRKPKTSWERLIKEPV
jgi:hypothetical protein